MRTLVLFVGIGGLLLAANAGSAELYKWVDERGVTNYSSEPPPKGRAAKTIADDRISVYTPETAVTQAIEAERHRRNNPPPAPVFAGAPPPPPPGSAPRGPSVQVIPPRTAVASDPCLTANDPNCYAPTIYDNSPVFAGRRRAPVLNQTQLPPGTIAGNVTGGTGITPGLTGLAPPVTPVAPPRGRLPSRGPGTGREFSAQ